MADRSRRRRSSTLVTPAANGTESPPPSRHRRNDDMPIWVLGLRNAAARVCESDWVSRRLHTLEEDGAWQPKANTEAIPA